MSGNGNLWNLSDYKRHVPDIIARAHQAEAKVAAIEHALDLLASQRPVDMYVLPPPHHACEREVTRLIAEALRETLDRWA
jgi:hypothetical protein